MKVHKNLITERVTQSPMQVLLYALIAIFSIVYSYGVAFAKFDGKCKVDDPTQGGWSQIPARCIIPGPPAADSGWPSGSTPSTSQQVYRIEGRYKLIATMSAEGFSLIPPVMGDRTMCISGYAEAYAQAAAQKYQDECDVFGSNCHTTFTVNGSMITDTYSYQGRTHTQYALYFDRAHVLYEWHCNDSSLNEVATEPSKNLGSPSMCPIPY